MNIQSLSPLLSLAPSFLRNTDLANHHSQDKDAERGDNNQLQNQLADDLYQPMSRVELDTSARAMQTVVTNVSHSAEIQVTTKEGDVVTINLNSSENHSLGDFQAGQAGSKVRLYNESNSFKSGFNLGIEGDLNENEQKSLADLINKMNDVSDDFFAGNIEAAFKHAQKIGLDTEQLAGFSMDLNREKSIQAVVTYQQTMIPEQNVKTDLLKQAGDFLSQTKEFMAGAAAMLDSFVEQKQLFTALFAEVGQMNVAAQDELEVSDSAFLKMIEAIGDDVFDG